MGGFDLGYLGKNWIFKVVGVFIPDGDSKRFIEDTTEAPPVFWIHLLILTGMEKAHKKEVLNSYRKCGRS